MAMFTGTVFCVLLLVPVAGIAVAVVEVAVAAVAVAAVVAVAVAAVTTEDAVPLQLLLL